MIEAYLGAEDGAVSLLVEDLHVRYGAIVALRGVALTSTRGRSLG